MCDEDTIILVTNTLGNCFTQFSLTESAQADLLESQTISFNIAEAGASIANLVDLFQVSVDVEWKCGDIGFRLLNETQAFFASVGTTGVVTIDTSSIDSSWLGDHVLGFEAFYTEIDEDITWPVALDFALTVSFEEPPNNELVDVIATTLVVEAPVAMQPIAELYQLHYNEEVSLAFKFANPIAVALQNEDPFYTEMELNFGDL